jgi:protein TonB
MIGFVSQDSVGEVASRGIGGAAAAPQREARAPSRMVLFALASALLHAVLLAAAAGAGRHSRSLRGDVESLPIEVELMPPSLISAAAPAAAPGPSAHAPSLTLRHAPAKAATASPPRPVVVPAPEPAAATEPPPPSLGGGRRQLGELPTAPAAAPGAAVAEGSEGGGDVEAAAGVGGGEAHAGFLSGDRPPYPAEARRSGMEGVVTLRILVAPDGTAAAVTVRQGSGFPVLDDAASRAARAWRFSPARRAGAPVAGLHDVRVRFRLSDPSIQPEPHTPRRSRP